MFSCSAKSRSDLYPLIVRARMLACTAMMVRKTASVMRQLIRLCQILFVTVVRSSAKEKDFSLLLISLTSFVTGTDPTADLNVMIENPSRSKSVPEKFPLPLHFRIRRAELILRIKLT